MGHTVVFSMLSKSRVPETLESWETLLAYLKWFEEACQRQ